MPYVLPQQIGNAIGFIPGCLLFSVFGKQGTSIIRALMDGEHDSPEFIQAVVVVVVGVMVVLVTVLLVRRTIKKLKAAGRAAELPADFAVPPPPSSPHSPADSAPVATNATTTGHSKDASQLDGAAVAV